MATSTPAQPVAAPPASRPSDNRILKKLLDRLFASLINGPSLNCRPHSSRQRIDLVQLGKLRDGSPEGILRSLLGPDREVKISAKVPAPKQRGGGLRAWSKNREADLETEDDDAADAKLSPEERAARQAFRDQQSALGKLRTIAEDSRTYENDTGVHVLQIGFPLLSLPPGSSGAGGALTRRIMAPLAFVSLGITIKGGPTPSVVLECRNEGADLVIPNVALLSWIERQTGQPIGELFNDETGEKPWAEIVAIARRVCELMQVEMPPTFAGDEMPAEFKLAASPRSDDEDDDGSPRAKVIPAAVVGLYPMANQGLLRDMQALAGGEAASGPIESFIKVDASLESPKPEDAPDVDANPVEKRTRTFSEDRLVATADPCQARAVRLARTSRGLVVHGPPGTGKSQTIANVIGDHLARGERVLFVCEKRTALDVVLNRLQALGLGSLCGIVHDPQRDQRELYKSIREQIDDLADAKSDAAANGSIDKIDAELQRLHDDLTAYHAALMKRPGKDALSFHELMGRWLSLPDFAPPLDAKLLESAAHELVESNVQKLGDLFDRAAKVSYAANPWAGASSLRLEDYLTTPIDSLRADVAAFSQACEAADATLDPAIFPLPATGELRPVAIARAQLAADLDRVRAATSVELRTSWAAADAKKIELGAATMCGAAEQIAKIEAAPLDRELAAIIASAPPSAAQIAQQALALDAYVQSTKSVLGFLAFGKKSAAAKVLAPFGLPPSPESAARVTSFFAAIKDRLFLKQTLGQLGAKAIVDLPGLPADDAMLAAAREHRALLDFLSKLEGEALLGDVRRDAKKALASPDVPKDFLRGLRGTAKRVDAIGQVDARLRAKLFTDQVRDRIGKGARGGQALRPTAQLLTEKLDTLENVTRVREGLASLPPELHLASAELLKRNVAGKDAVDMLRKASDATELMRRLKSNRQLMTADNQQLQSSFARYAKLEADKKAQARAAIVHLWTSRQKGRLLSGTGTRVNGLGADLRRRLTTRGERAMRLRQVVSVGQSIEGGDPLYDLRPVWLASPETVAQIFPRQALFDVVIFDEASQCRLEEALPVLLRAKRVVIAGDPKQLPPTRFFESAMAVSEEEEAENEQQLFESQQGEIEDLLAAALNIVIDECYLDVHYRSRNADLIEFSNEQFYGSRLQAIPGHPHNRSRFAPLTLYKVGGTYEKRENAIEADKVCEIVRDLLKRAQPPSIGIACFNISQRDLIVEKLEEMAEGDAAFAKALGAARERRSESSFEGLFVKNLENVQGDERDHMIISTTYGPDAKGKFYRRFGPVGTVGGGRRLNVLVTRARDEVHLVTSIPETAYRNLPEIPAGQTPGGAWLLFAYLGYAEKLAAEYELNHKMMEQVQATHEPVTSDRPSRFPSTFASELSERLLQKHRVGSSVHWGNDGFCVDVALHHPERAEDVTIGVLCDLNRFEQAADPIEWEVFRNAILQGQGWKLTRVWTPHFFRDEKGAIASVARQADEVAKTADDSNAIRAG